mmetsp:Transcript_111170/g.313713  ORF Transcript_111170/g.313713 Transcript_111170/m.313713 type:complete len:271 (-) Transcript_111170:9-821(-)
MLGVASTCAMMAAKSPKAFISPRAFRPFPSIIEDMTHMTSSGDDRYASKSASGSPKARTSRPAARKMAADALTLGSLSHQSTTPSSSPPRRTVDVCIAPTPPRMSAIRALIRAARASMTSTRSKPTSLVRRCNCKFRNASSCPFALAKHTTGARRPPRRPQRWTAAPAIASVKSARQRELLEAKYGSKRSWSTSAGHWAFNLRWPRLLPWAAAPVSMGGRSIPRGGTINKACTGNPNAAVYPTADGNPATDDIAPQRLEIPMRQGGALGP